MVMVTSLWHLSSACFFYPALTDYKKLGMLSKTYEFSNYWTLPQATLENTQEEAVMLIGGVMLKKIILKYTLTHPKVAT